MRPDPRYIGAAAVALLPALILSDVRLAILYGVVVTAIAALGLDILVARTGELSLAHGAFLGVGAFAAINIGGRNAPWWFALLGAVVVTAAMATVVGLPSLRIRGLQVAIATLAFQDMAEKLLFVRTDVTGGERVFERPGFLDSDVRMYFLALAGLVLTLVVRSRVARTRVGRGFVAVRDVPGRAVAFGVEPGPTKLFAYALSGAVVGLAGGLLALREGAIGTATDPFKLLESLQLVAVVVVGGAGSAVGVVIAAVVVKGIPLLVDNEFLRDWMPLTSAGLLVLAVVAQPTGIGGVVRRFARRPDPPPPAEVDLASVRRPLRLRMPTPLLLEATDVSVTYGGLKALDRVSLEVRRGEIVGLIGANGAGKSTFFHAVSGLAPAMGSIRFKDVELLASRPARRTWLGVARTFQEMGLVRAETVFENVLLAQSGLDGVGEPERRRRAAMALDVFDLRELAHARLGELPYGTMRRVELASAVAAGPELLLLDEASAGLGPEESHALGEVFLRLRDELGLTLVVIEHHVPLISRVCDVAYCLESGRLLASGTPAEVTADPHVVASFLGTPS